MLENDEKWKIWKILTFFSTKRVKVQGYSIRFNQHWPTCQKLAKKSKTALRICQALHTCCLPAYHPPLGRTNSPRTRRGRRGSRRAQKPPSGRPGLKDPIGERSDKSNSRHQNSVKILPEFEKKKC